MTNEIIIVLAVQFAALLLNFAATVGLAAAAPPKEGTPRKMNNLLIVTAIGLCFFIVWDLALAWGVATLVVPSWQTPVFLIGAGAVTVKAVIMGLVKLVVLATIKHTPAKTRATSTVV